MKFRPIILLAGAVLLLGVSTASLPASAANVIQVPECKFAGQALPGIDLRTTNVSGTDPHWTVTGPANPQPPGTPAVGGPIHAKLTAWTAVSAQWIQPFATSTVGPYGDAWPNTAVGDYTYTIQFNLPCDPASYTHLGIVGSIAADNSFRAYLNGTSNLIASCATGNCFKSPDGPKHIVTTTSMFKRGLNTITVVIHNDGNYTGLAVKAGLTARCGKTCVPHLPTDE